MRFENWDILLFPQASGIPLQEFRTECYGIVNPIGLCPTLNTYLPSLPCGTPFKISLHSWTKPILSSSKFVRGHQVVLGMHVAIDGKTVAVQRINPDGNFPHQVFNTPTNQLLFPPFRPAMRNQLQLHIADNVGRITVGLSEGYFYVANGTGKPHFCPVKDIVNFKWIHAPQDLLRKAGIAWPNATLFNKPQDASTYNHLPHMSYPVEKLGSEFVFPTMHATGVVDSFTYPSADTHAVDQIVTDTSHIDLSDLTTDYFSDYAFGASLSDSIHAPPHLQTAKMSSDQVKEITNAIVPALIERGVTMLDGSSDTRNMSDISMHTSCDQYPACVMDAHDGKDVLHMPQKPVSGLAHVPRGRKRIGYVHEHHPAKNTRIGMIPEEQMLRLSMDS